jgi:uncharacterized membrane protein YphA (DoxX/SURF4 family)
MADVIVVVATVALGAVFAWAGLAKIFAADRWRTDLRVTYRLPRPVAAMAFVLVPWTELGVVVALLTGWYRLGAAVAVVLLVASSIAIVRARVIQGTDRLSCGCFGGSAPRDYRVLLLRNGGLIVSALALLATAADGPLPHGRVDVLAGAIITLAIVASAWALWQLRAYLRRGSVAGASVPDGSVDITPRS